MRTQNPEPRTQNAAPSLVLPRGEGKGGGISSCFLLLASCSWILLACAAQEPPKKPKGIDGPGDAERRKRFLEGDSAADAKLLVETNNPAHLDAVARFFQNEKKPYKERLDALQALKLLKSQDEEEYKRVHPEILPALSLEASRGLKPNPLNDEEQEMLLAAISWHADVKYDHARFALEAYVDTDLNRVRHAKLPDRIRETAVALLGLYPSRDSSRDTLWGALVERWEKDGLRQACYDTLRRWDGDLKERILALKPLPKDAWLRDLQRKLGDEK